MEYEIMKNELNSGMRGGMFTTLNLEDEKDTDLILSTQDNDSMLKVNDNVGKVLEVIGLYIREKKIQDVNDDGELYDRYKHTTILFTSDGNMYVTGSNSFYSSLDFICALKGYPTREKPLKIKIGQSDAETKGHKFLKAILVK